MPLRTRIAALAIIAVFAAGASACSQPFKVTVEPTGAAMTGVQAERLAAGTDISALASVSTTDAPSLRVSVLSDLRTQGDFGKRAAELLTVGFPEQTASVPVLVRGCRVDGVDAVVAVEAFGSEGTMLVHRRLWVFDRATGAVLRAASVR
jgi:hypothetical protein